MKYIFLSEIWKTGRNTSSRSRFHGGCIDTGAHKSVIGLKQAKAYCKHHNIPFKLKPSHRTYRFGDGAHSSVGSLEIRIPIPGNRFFNWIFDVLNADIPMLIGLDFLDEHNLVANNVKNSLISEMEGWSIPITRQFGHLYVNWEKQILYTRSELERLHRHFYHPSSNKLYNLIKKATPNQADSNTLNILNQISESCTTCQTFSSKPYRFRVSIPPEKIIFNEEISLDLMWLGKRPVLHVVDTHTNFGSASFLRGQSAEQVWNSFIECWCAIYTGYPTKMRLDQGSNFKSTKWRDYCDSVGISIQYSGVESHNSIGNGERYHQPLRRIYNKIALENPSLKPETSLKLAIKAINDTMNSEGLVPSLLVFGCLPRFPGSNTNYPIQKDRFEALKTARAEMEQITAELRIRKALLSRVPRSADIVFSKGQLVRVFRESDSKYVGPYPIIRIEEKQVFLLINDKEVQFSIHQLIPAKEYEEIKNGDRYIKQIHHMMKQFKSTSQKEYSTNKDPKILITEILHPRDPRVKSSEATAAKKKEIESLIKRGTWTVVVEEDIPDDANIMTGHFVITIKNVETNEPIFKARYVIHGNQDDEKDILVHNSTTIRQVSTKIILCLAAIFGFRVWNDDVSQAYLQSASSLIREVYMKPSKEFEIPAGHLLKLLKPLYGLSDSGDYWNVTFKDHIQSDLGMESTVSDKSLFFKLVQKKLQGLMGTYVDDSLLAGDDEFLKLSEKTIEKFESKEREFDNIRFAGVYIETLENGFRLHQKSYIERLQLLNSNASFEDLRRARAKLSWLIHTRPEVCVAASMLAQVTSSTFDNRHIKIHNKIVLDLKKNPEDGLRMKKLDKKSLVIRAYSDSSFANNEDQKSQLGFIILLCDKFNNCNILHYNSYKAKRINRSVLGAEVYAFADAFDYAFTLKHDLEEILQSQVPLQILTDSKSLFDIITKSSTTTERRLMIDIKSVREGYENFDISDVGFIRSEHNPADSFTKIGNNNCLQYILNYGKCDMPIEKWVIRTFNEQKKEGV